MRQYLDRFVVFSFFLLVSVENKEFSASRLTATFVLQDTRSFGRVMLATLCLLDEKADDKLLEEAIVMHMVLCALLLDVFLQSASCRAIGRSSRPFDLVYLVN